MNGNFSITEWADLHNWNEDNDDFSGASDKTVTIFVDEHIDYEFEGVLMEYRNMPCEFDIQAIFIVHYDGDGEIVRRIEVETVPNNYIEEALKLAVEKY